MERACGILIDMELLQNKYRQVKPIVVTTVVVAFLFFFSLFFFLRTFLQTPVPTKAEEDARRARRKYLAVLPTETDASSIAITLTSMLAVGKFAVYTPTIHFVKGRKGRD